MNISNPAMLAMAGCNAAIAVYNALTDNPWMAGFSSVATIFCLAVAWRRA